MSNVKKIFEKKFVELFSIKSFIKKKKQSNIKNEFTLDFNKILIF